MDKSLRLLVTSALADLRDRMVARRIPGDWGARTLRAVVSAACLAVLSVAPTAAADSLALVETDQTITVLRDQQAVVTYNKISPAAPRGVDSIYRRSGCLHPVNSPRGRTVTAMFPSDHPHQHGIFSAWVKTTYDGRAVDFWNLAGGTGRVLHERVVARFEAEDRTGFVVDLLHRSLAEPSVDILRERWTVTVYPTDGTYHCFDIDTTQSAITDQPLAVDKYHYGGMALRGPTRWLTDRDGGAPPADRREASDFVNDLGSDRLAGNHQHAKWVALSGSIDGQPISIAVLSHSTNFRAPQAARLHPTKPYFCFAPCVDGPFLIDRDHPLTARYRYLVTDQTPDSTWLAQQWATWSGK